MANSLFDLTRFSKEILERFSLKESTKEFLQVIGLPTWAGLGLYFGDFDGEFLTRLNDWPWLTHTPPEEYASYIVIGAGGDDNPICLIEESEQIIYLDQENSFELIFMNSSILQLAASLNSHKSLVEEAMHIVDMDVYIEEQTPQALIEKLEAELKELDSKALSSGAYWPKEIKRIKEKIKKFDYLEKYTFKLTGWSQKGSVRKEQLLPVNLEEVVLLADGPVIRAISDFFLQCADGIEEHGKQWDHEHLRNNWEKWYNDYPDIIVVVNQSR